MALASEMEGARLHIIIQVEFSGLALSGASVSPCAAGTRSRREIITILLKWYLPSTLRALLQNSLGTEIDDFYQALAEDEKEN